MLRITFDRELQALQDQILQLGSEVEENLIKSTDALKRRDLIRSRQMIVADQWINEKRIKIGMDALTLIATQQPLAGDMRLLAAIVEIVGELERIHDYIKGIGKISLLLDEVVIPQEMVSILVEMAEKSRNMLHLALDAFTNRDADLAQQIPQKDDEVDNLYNDIYLLLMAYVMQNGARAEQANRIQWAAHNLERAADRVINICEWIVYMVKGVYREMDEEFEIPPIT